MNRWHWQPEIIRLLAVVASAALTALAAVPARVQAQGTACVSCLVIGVDQAELTSMPAMPAGALQGLQVLVPLTGSTRTLEPTGALIAVLVEPSDAITSAELLFDARTAMTALRADRPDVRVVIDGRAFADRGVALKELTPYADAVVGVTWTRLSRATHPSVDDLVAASLVRGSERTILPVKDIDWNAVHAFLDRRAEAIEVGAERRLAVGEVLARYQARQRRQDATIRTTIARGTTTLLFEVPDFAAPITITANTTIFGDAGATSIEQQDIRVNGAPLAGGDARTPPELPLIDAERISTPPLRIALDEGYDYALDGDEVVGESRCYVVRFEPRSAMAGLARGRAWIDADDFTLRRLQTVQSGLRGAIVSSEELNDFGPVDVGGTIVWLPETTRVFQSYEGAGFRTPIHRTVVISGYEVNSAAFDAQLAAALASDHVMMRDTPAGLRYLVRAGDTGDRTAATRGDQAIRSLIGGVLVDPNISTPLVFAGLSYVNFDLFGRGAQLNAFFGGVFGQLSWSVPALGGSRWQTHGTAFGVAARYTDRVFRSGREQYAENLLQRPASVSVGVLRPLTSRMRATVDYVLDTTSVSRTSSTPALFIVPAAIVNHGALLAIDADRGAWSLRLWWNPVLRQRWRTWGMPGQFDSSTRAYQRYGVRLRRSLAVHSSISARVDAAWMGGHDLDRFSRFGFDSFDNPLHGYPTASIRYDHGAVLRTATAFTWRRLRLDAFGDAALVADAGWSSATRLYPGAGLGLESGAPFRTLASIEWAYGFRAPSGAGTTGTQTLRLTLYKPF
jgi:hypothetical protein